MKRFYRWLFIGLLMLTVAGAALAQVSPNFDLGWHMLSGGGGSRLGAADRTEIESSHWSAAESSSSHYQVAPGFWHPSRVIEKTERLYAPLVINSQP